VVTAASGEEGLRLAARLSPTVITLDVLMPGLDGWSVLRRLKADPALAGVPVVMVTILDDAQHGYALGASDFLTKPIIERERLKRVLQRHHQPAAAREVRIRVPRSEPASTAGSSTSSRNPPTRAMRSSVGCAS
jgi:CheY-like chemotaxis protein